MCCKNVFTNTMFVLLYIYGFIWMIMDLFKSGEIIKEYICKKEMSFGLLLSMWCANWMAFTMWLMQNIIGCSRDSDDLGINELKHVRQSYLAISVYVIVIHIEYTNWIFTCFVFYIYVNICIQISEIIYKKEKTYLDNYDTQSVPVDIERGDSHASTINTPVIGIPLIQQTNQSTDSSD